MLHSPWTLIHWHIRSTNILIKRKFYLWLNSAMASLILNVLNVYHCISRMYNVSWQRWRYQAQRMSKWNRFYGIRSLQTRWHCASAMEHSTHMSSKQTVLNTIHWINQKMHGKLLLFWLFIYCEIQLFRVNFSCACWSPKGKQIVVAFPNGKLAQYKPDLKLAKAIPCTTPLFPGTFSPIAVQWLSTYQFAVVFVEDKVDAAQCNYWNVTEIYFRNNQLIYSFFHIDSIIHCECTENSTTNIHQLLWHNIQSDWT